MRYKLYERVQFIKNTLGFSDDEVLSKSYGLFCREYGRKADTKDNDQYYYDSVVNKHPRLKDIIDFKWLSENLSHKMGLYMFLSKDNKVLYIGKTTDLFRRIPSSYYDKNFYRSKYGYIKQIKYLIVNNEADLHILELLYIAKYRPPFNTDCKTRTRSVLLKNTNIPINKNLFVSIPIKI